LQLALSLLAPKASAQHTLNLQRVIGVVCARASSAYSAQTMTIAMSS